MVEILGKEGSRPKKERETKDDARYIIFYEFFNDDEVGEKEPPDKEGTAS